MIQTSPDKGFRFRELGQAMKNQTDLKILPPESYPDGIWHFFSNSCKFDLEQQARRFNILN
jgi:hypothetical protein